MTEPSVTFESFLEAELGSLRRFAAVLTGHRELAEDVLQDVLIRANARWDRIGPMDHRRAYVRRMVVNEYLSWRRRSWRSVPAGTAEEVSDGREPDIAATVVQRHALLAELARLPRRQRAVIVLRYYEGLSDSEVAQVLGCRPATVRGYAARALAALRVDPDTPRPRQRQLRTEAGACPRSTPT
jgi:RNA polymerase sigma-70 factor (sigma-E family)